MKEKNPTDWAGWMDLWKIAITASKTDPTIAVLKTHLLIEELLVGYIDGRVKNPTALTGARLTFGQRLALVRALHPWGIDDPIWGAVERLNGLRNLLAHRRDAALLPNKLQEFMQYVVTSRPFKTRMSVHDRDIEMILGSVFSALHIVLEIDVLGEGHDSISEQNGGQSA